MLIKSPKCEDNILVRMLITKLCFFLIDFKIGSHFMFEKPRTTVLAEASVDIVKLSNSAKNVHT